MQQRVIVNGAFGKMGVVACETLHKHPEFELVARLGRDDDLAATISRTRAQIVIDLTRADCVYENSLTIIKEGAHPIIGTSGLLAEQIDVLQKACDEHQLGGLIVPNFSISAVLMMRFAAIAASFLPDVEIIETHHPQKLDAPSGTAIKTADVIAAHRTIDSSPPALKELLPGARGAIHHDIRIHSLRLPGTLARQDVIFGQMGETLTITHNTIDRISFMPGMMLCCQKVGQLTGLHYGLEHIL
jgi:4-hydroxy-tetrahydrodipicolinate reductase